MFWTLDLCGTIPRDLKSYQKKILNKTKYQLHEIIVVMCKTSKDMFWYHKTIFN